MDYENLAQAALDAREKSYSPYSNFQVGAALLTKNGKIYTGCNIESAAYSPTNCAERTALFKAVSEGEREFTAIAIAGAPQNGTPQYCYPCGVCRQMLNEFLPQNATVIIVKTATDYKAHTFSELLPFGFGAENLD
ncbi:MAG: cytidine deaminase [Defluviitaleaceae bacterium]|nr:cytidine deaminase [Defluviitaleaceae bacterium]MCL2263075.1 cytidine deaminase [Defluviitaleaceae bacterium]